VAGDHQGDGVGGVGAPDGASGSRPADLGCDLCVGGGLSVGNGHDSFTHLDLKRGHARPVDGGGEMLTFSLQVFDNFPEDGGGDAGIIDNCYICAALNEFQEGFS
jgi:hypothetical protein